MRNIKLRLKPKHLLVFAVKEKRNMSGIYIGTKGFYADHHELMAVWIADMGPDCDCLLEGVGIGAKAYVIDTYELGTEIPDEAAASYGPKMPFKDEILAEARKYDGRIKAFILHENSLACIEEDSWKKKPISSLEQLSLEKPPSAEMSGTAL
jgi:hypothetical protein